MLGSIFLIAGCCGYVRQSALEGCFYEHWPIYQTKESKQGNGREGEFNLWGALCNSSGLPSVLQRGLLFSHALQLGFWSVIIKEIKERFKSECEIYHCIMSWFEAWEGQMLWEAQEKWLCSLLQYSMNEKDFHPRRKIILFHSLWWSWVPFVFLPGQKLCGSVLSLKLNALFYVVRDPWLVSFGLQDPNSSDSSSCSWRGQCI